MLALAVLLVAIACRVMQFTIQREAGARGPGDLPDTSGAKRATTPLGLLLDYGLMAVAIWALVELSLLRTIVVVLVGYVICCLIWGFVVAELKRQAVWGAWLRAETSIVLWLRLVIAASIIFLAAIFLNLVRP
jgi:hypothetical protein